MVGVGGWIEVIVVEFVGEGGGSVVVMMGDL